MIGGVWCGCHHTRAICNDERALLEKGYRAMISCDQIDAPVDLIRLWSIQPPQDSSVAETGHTDWFFLEEGVDKDDNKQKDGWLSSFGLVKIISIFVALAEKKTLW